MNCGNAPRGCSFALGVGAALLLAATSCADTEPPVIVETTVLGDTMDAIGPYEIFVTATDDRGVQRVELYFGAERAAATQFAVRVMEKAGKGRWRGEIPGFAAGSAIDYYVSATDHDGNRQRDPAEGAYVFRVRSADETKTSQNENEQP